MDLEKQCVFSENYPVRKFKYLLLPVVFSTVLLLIGHESQAVKTKKKKLEKSNLSEDCCDLMFIKVETLAQFKGGVDSFRHFLEVNTIYPDSAINANIEGVVRCQFVISNKGKVMEAQIINGLGYGLDEEVLRVINSMPDWLPAEQGGRGVSYRLVQSFTFSIPLEDKIKKRACDDVEYPIL
ncbi:MAG: energy transducer TonB [Bacteroidota bacterium]